MKIYFLVMAIAISLFSPLRPVEAKLNGAGLVKLDILKKQLKSAPRHSTSFSKVKALVTKLVKLDPKKAEVYFSLGLRRLKRSTPQSKVAYLARMVAKIVYKSGLPPARTDICKCVASTPTPTPTE